MLYKDCTSTGESLYFLYFREKKRSMLTQSKEEKQRKYRQSDGFIVLKNVGNATGWKGATYGNNQWSDLRNTQRLAKQENNFRGEKCWIHRDSTKDQPYEEPDAGKPHVRIWWGACPERGASTRPLTILERRHWREADAAVLHSSTDRKNLIYMVW